MGRFHSLSQSTKALYQIGRSSSPGQGFHDIADLSTNLFYPAVTGYDLSTGFGSFNGQSLISILSNSNGEGLVAPNSVYATPHNQVATLSWPSINGALSYIVSRSLSSSGPFTQVSGSVFANSFTDVGLRNGTTYYYEVEAQNINSHSVASVPVSVTPALMAPQAPTDFFVTVED